MHNSTLESRLCTRSRGWVKTWGAATSQAPTALAPTEMTGWRGKHVTCHSE